MIARRRAACLAALALALGACEAPLPEPTPFPISARAPEPDDAATPTTESTAPAPDRVADLLEAMEPTPPPRPRIGDDTTYAFEFRETPIPDALRLIAEKAGLNFVVPSDAYGVVSASLPNVTLDQAVDVVLTQGKAELTEVDGVYSVQQVQHPDLLHRTFRPRSADIKLFTEQISAVLGQESGAFTVNPAANVVYVSAPPDRMREVELLLEAMDEAPRQVLIEARIVEIGLDTRFEMGVATSFGDISAGETASTLVTDFLRAAGDFRFTTIGLKYDVNTVIQALQQFGRLHVIANPRVIALNHELAKIDIVERIPYIEATATTTTEADGAGASTVEQIEFEEVGIRLHVTPVLGDGDLITLKILQEVSEVVDFFNTVPVTDERNVDTKLVVSDRETIVIGGLLKERTRKNESGVPILMDIPLLGYFFRGEDVVREKVELLIFLTPRIVEEHEVMGVSTEYKRELKRKSAEYLTGYPEFLEDVE